VLLAKNNVSDQNWRESGPAEHPKKMWNPLRMFETVEASNFKFGTQVGFGTSLPKTTFRTKMAGVWAKGASKKCGTPCVFLQPLKLATSNLVHSLGLGISYQKTTFRTKIGGGLCQGSIRKNLGPPIYYVAHYLWPYHETVRMSVCLSVCMSVCLSRVISRKRSQIHP